MAVVADIDRIAHRVRAAGGEPEIGVVIAVLADDTDRGIPELGADRVRIDRLRDEDHVIIGDRGVVSSPRGEIRGDAP